MIGVAGEVFDYYLIAAYLFVFPKVDSLIFFLGESGMEFLMGQKGIRRNAVCSNLSCISNFLEGQFFLFQMAKIGIETSTCHLFVFVDLKRVTICDKR